MSPVLQLMGWLARRAENVASTMLAVMFAAFIIQIFFRYVANFPIGWTQELERHPLALAGPVWRRLRGP